MGRRYTSIRWIASVLLLSQVGINWGFKQFQDVSDLYLFPMTTAFAALFILLSPRFNDRVARISTSLGIALWSIGTLITTVDSYYQLFMPKRLGDFFYLAFYPFVFLGIIRSLAVGRGMKPVDLLDIVIITLGMSSVISSFFLNLNQHSDALTYFFSIIYPIADSILLISTVALILMQKLSSRTTLALIGVILFSITDFIFLFKVESNSYHMGSWIDFGWVLGFLFLMESMWHHPTSHRTSEKLTSVGALIAMVASALLLAYSTIHPTENSSFTIIPALVTVFLSFIRMGIALRDARGIHDERELARTDELTGLNNRRRFIAALDKVAPKDQCSLLLLDLDGFKYINDSLGHESGDLLLKEISTRFARQMPRGALLARLGGDEFGVLVSGEKQAGVEVARAMQSCLSYPIHLNGHDVRVGVSIGGVVNDGKGESMRRADEAMYLAKRSVGGAISAEWSSPQE